MKNKLPEIHVSSDNITRPDIHLRPVNRGDEAPWTEMWPFDPETLTYIPTTTIRNLGTPSGAFIGARLEKAALWTVHRANQVLPVGFASLRPDEDGVSVFECTLSRREQIGHGIGTLVAHGLSTFELERSPIVRAQAHSHHPGIARSLERVGFVQVDTQERVSTPYGPGGEWHGRVVNFQLHGPDIAGQEKLLPGVDREHLEHRAAIHAVASTQACVRIG